MIEKQLVWIIPDNDNAYAPVPWVDRDSPEFSDTFKGELIEATATIYNEGSSTSFTSDDEESDSETEYNTKGIVIDKLMYIKGCKDRTITTRGGTTQQPTVTISHKKVPKSYIFLKKPDISGSEVKSSETKDIDPVEDNITFTFSFDDYNLNTTGHHGGSSTYIAALEIYIKRPDDSVTVLTRLTTASNSSYYRNQKISTSYSGTTINYDENNRMTSVVATFSSTAALFSAGSKLCCRACIGPTFRYKSTEVEIGYFFSPSTYVHVYNVTTSASDWQTPSVGFRGEIRTEASHILTKNTPCWTFLNDIKRVNKGKGFVMKGSIRYIDYMSDLQPEGSEYRDYMPHEIGL